MEPLYNREEEEAQLQEHFQQKQSQHLQYVQNGLGAQDEQQQLAQAMAMGMQSSYPGMGTPELASLLQQEASQALYAGLMMGHPMMGAAGGLPMYRMPSGEMMPMNATGMEEEPLYVNAKQYNRILKRRQARAKLEAQIRLQREKPAYMHESRHRHAMNRPRGPGGRFLTGDEIKAWREKEAAQEKSADAVPVNGDAERVIEKVTLDKDHVDKDSPLVSMALQAEPNRRNTHSSS